MYDIKLYFRKLLKSKIFSTISIGGFAISLAVIINLLAFIFSEKSYDKVIPEVENIYRIIRSDKNALIPEDAKQLLEGSYPEVSAATNVIINRDPVLYNKDNFDVDIIHTDESFFSVFSIDFIRGLSEEIFEDKNHAVITESCARKIFGDKDPIGEILNVSHKEDVRVVAIVKDLPEQVSLHGELYCSSKLRIRYSSRGYNDKQVLFYKLYLKVHPGSDIASIESSISPEIQRFMDWVDVDYQLQKFSDIYFDTTIIHDDLQHANVKLIKLLSWLTFVLLVLAVFNYVNLSIAQSTNRLHEIGVKQVFGAGRRVLIFQFVSEAFLQVLLSFVIACALAFTIRPVLTEILGKEIQLSYIITTPVAIITLVTGLLAIAIFSGIYPALVTLRVQPQMLLLKQTSNIHESFDTKRILIVIQFAATIGLIISLLTISKQVNYVKNKDLGYNTELLVQIPVHYRIKKSVPLMLEEISDIAQVKSICASHGIPGSIWNYSSNNEFPDVSVITSGSLFIKTFELPILMGRNFFPDEQGRVCLINESLMKNAGGWKKIQHQKIFGSEVVGVISDFHYKDLYNPIGNLMIENGEDVSHLSVRFHPCDLSQAIKAVKAQFEKIAPDFAFNYRFYDDWLDSMYKQEEKRALAIRFMSVVAILFSCLGLFGMAEFSIKRRTREIGIRKVNGATVSKMLILLNFDFIKWVIVALVIACPVSWYIMNRWLDNFAYKTDLSWWIFLLTGIIAIGIAVFTVSWQTWTASNRNPVEVLRYE